MLLLLCTTADQLSIKGCGQIYDAWICTNQTAVQILTVSFGQHVTADVWRCNAEQEGGLCVSSSSFIRLTLLSLHPNQQINRMTNPRNPVDRNLLKRCRVYCFHISRKRTSFISSRASSPSLKWNSLRWRSLLLFKGPTTLAKFRANISQISYFHIWIQRVDISELCTEKHILNSMNLTFLILWMNSRRQSQTSCK